MCRACGETPDGVGRRCPNRENGFSAVEGNLRNRLRNLKRARTDLANGDAQSAANALQQAQVAQRALDGVAAAPVAEVTTLEQRPHRDHIVSPSDIDRAKALVAQENLRREKVGASPLEVEVSRQQRPVSGDDITVWEQATVRVLGDDEQDVTRFALPGVSAAAEKRVNTYAVLEAACAATRQDDGKYVSAQEGIRSTPAQVDAYVAATPGSPERERLRPTDADRKMARDVRVWARLQPATNEHIAAVRHSLSEETMAMRDARVATAAVSGYLRHRARVDGSNQVGGGGSRWLGRANEDITLTAKVVSVEPVQDPRRTFPGYVYLMRTPDGSLVRWKATSTQGLMVGDALTLSGRVKAHSMAGGERQTEVFYCRPRIHTSPSQATA